MGSENRSSTPFDVPAQPELEDVLHSIMRLHSLGMRTTVPASIVAFDPAQCTATVRVEILPVVKVDDPARPPKQLLYLKGTPPNMRAVLQPIQLSNIPVFVYGTDVAFVSVPLGPGATGFLHVCDRSIESWIQKGIPAEPAFAFTHALKDSAFYPGVRPKTKPLSLPVDMTATVVEGPVVKLGRNATTDSVAKAEDFLQALVTAITATVVVAQDGGASFKSTLLAQLALITPAQIGSIKVKVE